MLADLDRGCSQRDRIGGYVARRVQVSVFGAERAADGRTFGEGGVELFQLSRVKPADADADRILHGYPVTGRGLVSLAETRQQVTLRDKPGIYTKLVPLAEVKPPRPLPQPHCPLRTALGADDSGGAAAGPATKSALLHHDHPVEASAAQEVRTPGADRPAADHHRVRHRSAFPRARLQAGCWLCHLR